MTEYIAYQGEQPLGIGTLDELSQKVMAEDSIKVYKIEDDEIDVETTV